MTGRLGRPPDHAAMFHDNVSRVVILVVQQRSIDLAPTNPSYAVRVVDVDGRSFAGRFRALSLTARAAWASTRPNCRR